MNRSNQTSSNETQHQNILKLVKSKLLKDFKVFLHINSRISSKKPSKNSSHFEHDQAQRLKVERQANHPLHPPLEETKSKMKRDGRNPLPSTCAYKLSMETITNQEPHEQVIQNGSKILADNEDYQSMVINVNPISAQVKGAIRVTLNE
ncbi:hypothetical protein Golob_015042, partial [Gossypium lobatum]|nr:hypothetical protein [Gossypium lobatum]